jgi:hypothetical protein
VSGVGGTAAAPPAAWAADFSYAYYLRLLERVKAEFDVHPVCEAPELLPAVTAGRKVCLLRHDVDLSLGPAVRMAEIEAGAGVRATYYVLAGSPLYDLDTRESRAALRRLVELGHEVGLHYDVHLEPHPHGYGPTVESEEARLAEDCERVEAALGGPVRSLSFHRPLRHWVGGPLYVAGRVNAYAGELMGWYLSDSAGRWREGEPLARLDEPRGPLLQLLTHPVWWGERHLPAAEMLEEFFRGATAGMTAGQAAAFDGALAAQLSIRRSGRAPLPH